MELLNEDEIHQIIEKLGFTKVVNWSVQIYSYELVGYLGEHLTLIIDVGPQALKLFVKCMPRSDEWKANYIKELLFFKKEFVMLSKLFNKFTKGTYQWRPKIFLLREDLFVFEDVRQIGYKMPSNRETLTLDELNACVITLAHFHAQSYIYEENKSREMMRPYRIWEECGEYLTEPPRGANWRNAGRDAVIDFLKVYSKLNSNPKFLENVDTVITDLFDKAVSLMQPSTVYRNVVVHRDLWSNNIFLKKENGKCTHAIFVDFQTVVYSSPMLDLSSLIYFNTTRSLRENHIDNILDLYYEVLSKSLKESNCNINLIFDRKTLEACYEESITFGITQAALIIPITAIDVQMRQSLFCDPETAVRINEETRSVEFIDIAKKDVCYRTRVTDLFDEIVDRFICST